MKKWNPYLMMYEEDFDAVVDQCALLTSVHFPAWDGHNLDSLNCTDCEDFKLKACQGRGLQGKGVWGCMYDAIASGALMVMMSGPGRRETSRLTSSQRRKLLRRKRR